MSETNNHIEPWLQLDSQGNVECAICLQICVYPAKLPCGHVFCYLCIKGFTKHNKKCAMCRQDIPSNYLNKPELIAVEAGAEEEIKPNDYRWYYEGRAGWWQYDDRSSTEMENAWQSGKKMIDLFLAGNIYKIDFKKMSQSSQFRSRLIKRESVDFPAKGIAGITGLKNGQSSTTSTEPGDHQLHSSNAHPPHPIPYETNLRTSLSSLSIQDSVSLQDVIDLTSSDE